MLQLVHRYIEFHSTCNLRISVIFMYLQCIVYLFLCLSISVSIKEKKDRWSKFGQYLWRTVYCEYCYQVGHRKTTRDEF